MLFLGIKETTREYRLKKWAGIIAEQRKSGLTIRAFCADRDLSQHAFFYWLRLLRKELSGEKQLVPMENVPAFAPLSMAESPVVAADRLSLHYGTFQIDVECIQRLSFCGEYCRSYRRYSPYVRRFFIRIPDLSGLWKDGYA